MIDYDVVLLALISAIIFIKNSALNRILSRFTKWHDIYTILFQKPETKKYYFPFLWLISISLILFLHRPVWHHYYLLIATPLCWLAAISFSEFICANTYKNFFYQKGISHWLTVCVIILTLFRLPIKYHRMLESVKNKPTIGEHKIIDLLAANKNNIRWLITDRPIFAFYSGILIPPELVLISGKRIQAESFTQDYLLNILEKYKPEQLLFTRFTAYEKRFLPGIEKDYLKIYEGNPDNQMGVRNKKDMKLYLRKSR